MKKKFFKVGGILLLAGSLLFCGCGIERSSRTKIADMEYEILAEEQIPTELRKKIEEKKSADFKLTYVTEEGLYIVRGFGEQETGGYSICMKELYETSNAVVFRAELIGPRKGETITKSPSFPYIALSTKNLGKNVIFE